MSTCRAHPYTNTKVSCAISDSYQLSVSNYMDTTVHLQSIPDTNTKCCYALYTYMQEDMLYLYLYYLEHSSDHMLTYNIVSHQQYYIATCRVCRLPTLKCVMLCTVTSVVTTVTTTNHLHTTTTPQQQSYHTTSTVHHMHQTTPPSTYIEQTTTVQ